MTAKKFDLRRLLDALQDHDVSFVVIGGVAVVAHGIPLATFDLGICYARDAQNLVRLAAALRSLDARLRGAPPDVPFVLDDRTLGSGDHFTFETDGGDLDVMATPAGSAGYEQLAVNAEAGEFDRRTLVYASIEDLIRMKRSSGRDKDRVALSHLERLREMQEGET